MDTRDLSLPFYKGRTEAEKEINQPDKSRDGSRVDLAISDPTHARPAQLWSIPAGSLHCRLEKEELQLILVLSGLWPASSLFLSPVVSRGVGAANPKIPGHERWGCGGGGQVTSVMVQRTWVTSFASPPWRHDRHNTYQWHNVETMMVSRTSWATGSNYINGVTSSRHAWHHCGTFPGRNWPQWLANAEGCASDTFWLAPG